MLPRSSWKGFLRLSLVNIPVQAISAEAPGEGRIHLHQLHDKCSSRIQYKKFCPIHGEVSNNEIVTGYQHGKEEYVIVERPRRGRQGGKSELRTINIDAFVPPSTIDPIHFEGQSYYLVPDGDVGQQPYTVLQRAIEQQEYYGVGTGLFFGRERVVALRSLGGVLTIEMLHFVTQLRSASAIHNELELPSVNKEELRLAAKLIEASTTDRFDLAKYEDTASDELRELIQEKLGDKEVVSPAASHAPPVINLMDALRRSVSKAGKSSSKRAGSQAKATATRGTRHRRSAS